MKIRKYFKLNDDESLIYKAFSGASNAVLRKNLVVLKTEKKNGRRKLNI